MDYKETFVNLIKGYFDGKHDRKYIAEYMSSQVGFDEIKGDHRDLLPNCEIALRHINEEEYYTTESELRYYLSCLMGEKIFNEKERNELINKE